MAATLARHKASSFVIGCATGLAVVVSTRVRMCTGLDLSESFSMMTLREQRGCVLFQSHGSFSRAVSFVKNCSHIDIVCMC